MELPKELIKYLTDQFIEIKVYLETGVVGGIYCELCKEQYDNELFSEVLSRMVRHGWEFDAIGFGDGKVYLRFKGDDSEG